MTTNFVSKGIESIQKAVVADKEDNRDKYEEALTLYCQGINYLFVGLKYEKSNKQITVAIKSKIMKYLKRAEEIKQVLSKPVKEEKKVAKEGMNVSNDENEEIAKLKAALSGSVIVEKPNVSWSQVAGLDKAKSLLKEAVILPMKFPQLFVGKRKPWKGILLYGPPGTGKTYLAKAVASEANNSTFFSVSSSDLISKYVGESEKLIKYLFAVAKEEKPSIVFIDEIDSLATKRSDNEQDSTRRVKTEFLIQMQNAVTGVLVLGATNCPWDLDSGVRRRFAKRIYISLPDKQARMKMFKIHIGSGSGSGSGSGNHDDVILNEKDFDILADKTCGFSGSDIAAICQDALMEPVRTLQAATHFKKICDGNSAQDYIWIPCSSGDPHGTRRTLMEFDETEQDKIKCLPVKFSHFLRVLKNANPSVSKQDVRKSLEWTKAFGQKG